MAGKTVGELQIELKMDGNELSAELKNIEKKVEKTGKKNSSVASSFGKAWQAQMAFIQTATSKAFDAVTSVVRSGVEGAIKRIDTLNQFPKVMQAFGVSGDEAKASIDRISESIQGLPTSLDAAASGVQNLFMVTKDLRKAEGIFTAVNDAALMWADNASEGADRFIYAFKQAMSVGKVSAQDFNQMAGAIPVVMDKVAEVMGVTLAELKEGLSNGTISIDEFSNALVKLDTEGVGEMDAMRDGVFDATGGIQTAISRMKSAVERGWTEMFNAIGTENIADALFKVGKAIEWVMGEIGSVIKEVVDEIGPVIADFVKESAPQIKEMIHSIGEAAKKAIPMILPLIRDIFGWLADNIETVVPALLGIVGGFKALAIVGPLIGPIGNLVSILAKAFGSGGILATIFGGIKSALVWVFTTALPSIVGFISGTLLPAIGSLFAFIAANPVVLVISAIIGAIVLLLMNLDKIGAFMQDLGAKFKEWLTGTVFPAIGEFFTNAWNAVVSFFSGVWDKIVGIFGGVVDFFRGIFEGAWNAIKSIFGKVVDWFKGIFNGIVNVFKTVGTTIGNAVGGAFKAVVNGIIGFAEKFVNAPIKAINALIDVINAVPGISLGKLTELRLPRMAQGGLVTASTVANIGENGREAVLPLDRNTDNWSGLLASALADEFDARGGGGGGGITIEKQIFDISNEMDADDIGRKVMNSLRRAA